MQTWSFQEGNSSGEVHLGNYKFSGKASLTKTKDCSCTGNAITLVHGEMAGKLSITDMTMAGYSGYGYVVAQHTVQLTSSSPSLASGLEWWEKFWMHRVHCHQGCD